MEDEDVRPEVKADAQEFGLYTRQGGWRLGLLVARNVQQGKGQGSRTDTFPNGKVSANAFAKQAGVSVNKILRYLEAWDRYASEGKVKESASLSPGDELELDQKKLGKFRLSAPRPEQPESGLDEDPTAAHDWAIRAGKSITEALNQAGEVNWGDIERLADIHDMIMEFLERD